MACEYYMVVDITVPKKDLVWFAIRSHPCHVCVVLIDPARVGCIRNRIKNTFHTLKWAYTTHHDFGNTNLCVKQN